LRRRCGLTALIITIIATLTGCSGGDGSVEGAGSCALVVRYQGENYEGTGVQIAPLEGKRIGSAVLPGCEADEPDEQIPVAQLPGVSPKVALVWVGNNDTVLVREGIDLPPEVAQLSDAPKCDQRDAPIRLSGPWLGILGADGNTETDLLPPYDLDLRVKYASVKKYERAFITVRVQQELGAPLTRDDVRSSLLQEGSIALTIRCESERFVAQEVTAFPQPELIDDGVVSIRPKQLRPDATMTIVIRNPPGSWGLGWYLARKDGSEWTYIGGFRAGPRGQWKDHAFNRFYFLPKWRTVGLEDIAFDGNDSIDVKVPELEPGRYRIAASFFVDHEDEWHIGVFDVIEP
jgi:Family of unknown function (DUF6281)